MDFIELNHKKLDLNEVYDLVAHESCGAVSYFVGTTRDNFEDKQLIECVKENEFLYNQENPHYSNNLKKDRAWEEIGKILKHSGPECKKQWNYLRDTYRRTLKKNKETQSGQAAIKPKKWKYEETMSFLQPYMRERETISSVDVDLSQLDTSDAVDESTNSSIERTEYVSPTTNTPPVKRRVNIKRKITDETASSTLMKYILEKDKAEQNSEIDLFFKSLAGMVKKLSPFNQSLAKSRCFKVVSELEMEELTQKQSLQLAASVSRQNRAELSRLNYSSSDDSSTMHPLSPIPSTSYTTSHITESTPSTSDSQSTQGITQFYLDFSSNFSENSEL